MASNWNIQLHHDLQGMDQFPRNGRNPFDGYLRGCGLQFGNIVQLCLQDTDFQAASRLAEGRTIVDPTRLMNLFMLIKFFLPKIQRGHIFEFGSYKGGSAIFMACLARRFLQDVQVYSFDTFQGMPTTDRGIDIHKEGDFRDADLEELRRYVSQVGLNNLHFVQGRFEDTAPAALQAAGLLAMIHIDCDIYSAVAYCYDTAKDALVRGGYIVLDDPVTSSCLGAFEAMEALMIRRDGLHAEQVVPHLVFRYPPI
jgi:predicted O-methyltransferase YrrM